MGNFKVGQKVVCIEPIEELTNGEIYTVTNANVDAFNDYGIMVKGITATKILGKTLFYLSSRFRAIDDSWVENILEEIECDEVIIKS